MFSAYFSACLLNRLRRQRRQRLLGNGNEKTAPALQLNGERRGLNLDKAFSQTNIQGHSGLYAGLLANLLRNNHTPTRIDGCFHARNNTI